MLSTAIIIFREVLEISLIVGVLLAATRGLIGRKRWVWAGFVAGALGSGVVAFFAESISNAAQGMGQELFNATVLFVAAVLIGWTTVWMARCGRQLTQHFKEIGRAVCEGQKPLYTLAVVIVLAVLREGSEIVLFLYGILASGENISGVLTGSAMGGAAGVLAGAAIYYGLVKVSAKSLFSVTSWLLAFLAAGMVSQGLGMLASAGFVPEIVSPVWDTSRFLSESSWVGRVLHALLGYSEKPSGIQLVGYFITLGGIGMLLKWFGSSGKKMDPLKKVTACLVAAIGFGVFGLQADAHATKKVYSPIVEKGELEIEARGSYAFDDDDDVDGTQKQKYAIGYGFTEWWFTEVYGEFEKEGEEVGDGEDDPDLEFEAVSWENRFQLSEPGEWWLDTGLYFEYEFATEDEHADKIEGKLLLQKELGNFIHILNLILEKEVNAPDDVEEEGLEGGFAWSTRYRFEKWLEPGFEWHSDFGELDENHSWDEEKHQVGPVLYGKIGEHLKYDIGYLFGISEAAPDGELKWIVEWEWHF